VTCPFAHDDGAYVLGALSPGERSAYEKHLAGCAECREAVSEIAVLPGLLGRLPASRVVGSSDSDSSESRMPALLAAAQERRSRERTVRRRRYAGAGVAAAVVAVLAGVGVAASWPSGSGSGPGPDALPGSPGVSVSPTPVTVYMVAMTPVAGKVPVTAEIGLNGTQWGTEVTMHCTYPEADYTRAYTFRLVAHGVDGASEQVGSWMAGPGDDITVTGATRFGGSDLVRLEITKYDGTPLLAYDVP
jgi:hypothetical protein